MKEKNIIDELSKNKIEKPNKPKKFKNYSYKDCFEMAKKLKDSYLFEFVVSDNIIELFINNQSIFIQLLGYYNGDRNIIIYGDYNNFKANYHYLMHNDYPDVIYRINYHEIAIDDSKGFFDEKMKKELDKMHLNNTPLIFNIEKGKGTSLAKGEYLNIIGAILESLLEINNNYLELIKDEFIEGNYSLIVQLYLEEDNINIGHYHDYSYEKPIIEDEIFKATILPIKKGEKTSISLGLYFNNIENQKTYITLIYDNEKDLIINGIIKKEDDLNNLIDEIISSLNNLNIIPYEIIFNNKYTFEYFIELINVYEGIDFSIGNTIINEIYHEMLSFVDNRLTDDDFIH